MQDLRFSVSDLFHCVMENRSEKFNVKSEKV